MDSQTLARHVRQFLSDDADAFLALAQPSAWLRLRGPDEPLVAVLGGEPELPSGVPWPAYQELPLSFLAEVDFGTVSALLPEAMLGARVQFFWLGGHFGPDDEFIGAPDPTTRDAWRAVAKPHAVGGGAWPTHGVDGPFPRRRPDGSDEYGREELTVELHWTVPDPHVAAVHGFDFGKVAQLHNGPLWEHQLQHGRVFHRVGGWPYDPGPFLKAAKGAAIAANYPDGVPLDYDEPPDEPVTPNAHESWFLLLELEGDGKTGFIFGDAWPLQFLIDRDDLQSADLNGTWLTWGR